MRPPRNPMEALNELCDLVAAHPDLLLADKLTWLSSRCAPPASPSSSPQRPSRVHLHSRLALACLLLAGATAGGPPRPRSLPSSPPAPSSRRPSGRSPSRPRPSSPSSSPSSLSRPPPPPSRSCSVPRSSPRSTSPTPPPRRSPGPSSPLRPPSPRSSSPPTPRPSPSGSSSSSLAPTRTHPGSRGRGRTRRERRMEGSGRWCRGLRGRRWRPSSVRRSFPQKKSVRRSPSGSSFRCSGARAGWRPTRLPRSGMLPHGRSVRSRISSRIMQSSPGVVRRACVRAQSAEGVQVSSATFSHCFL